jgi:ABC-type sugar transport system permease subunit
VLPVVVLVTALIYIPLGQAFYYSFTNWDGSAAPFIGLANYSENFFKGPGVQRILINNLLILASIPLILAAAFVVAAALHRGAKGASIFRSIYFLPVALSGVATGIAATMIFNGGPYSVGNWLGGSWTSLAAVIATFAWAAFGVNAIILLAGMSTIDPDVMEAALLDGAGEARRLWYIVLPAMRRFVEFGFFITLVAAMTQLFPLIYTMTSGGPGFSTTTLEFSLYNNGFNNGRFGLAAATGIILLLITAVLTWPRVRAGARSS